MDPSAQWAAVADRVKSRIGEVIDSGRFILGPLVREAELELAARVGAAHGVGVANGTDALVIALQALGLEPGDEVICPAYTFYATAEAIVQAGGVPVFADVREDTLCLDPEAAEAAVGPRTRALLPVHLFGHPADAPALRAICDGTGCSWWRTPPRHSARPLQALPAARSATRRPSRSSRPRTCPRSAMAA